MTYSIHRNPRYWYEYVGKVASCLGVVMRKPIKIREFSTMTE